MRANIGLFYYVGGFFFSAAVLYTTWVFLAEGTFEWVGIVALLLCAAMGIFIAFYLQMHYKKQSGELPEDRPNAEIDDGDPEIGHFSPWSWWPITLAAAAAFIMLGLAVGYWIAFFIGAPLAIVALVGWVYEYYRGNFAR